MSIFRRKVRGRRCASFSAKFMFRGRLHRRSGFPDRESAQHWVDTTRVSLRRGEIGYVKARFAAKIIPLIEEYVAHLETLKRSDKYVYTTERRLKKMASESPWITLADLTSASFDAWRAGKPKYHGKVIKPRTLNQYLDHATEFAGWLVKPRQFLPSNPLASLSRVNAPINNSYRRAATMDELKSLLAAAPKERALAYRFLLYVPLRRRAIEAIEWRDLQLADDPATLTLRAELNKTGREVKLAIRRDLAAELVEHRGTRTDDDLIFQKVPTIDELREDLKSAKIPFDDGKGQRRLDLHSFRKTVIRILKRAGVSIDEAHVFLQHRDPRTTQRHYDDDSVAPETSRAAEKMPAMGIGAHLGANTDNSAVAVDK